MNKQRFTELTEALQHAKAVRQGQAMPARVWQVTRGKDGQVHRRQLDAREYQQERRTEWEFSP